MPQYVIWLFASGERGKKQSVHASFEMNRKCRPKPCVALWNHRHSCDRRSRKPGQHVIDSVFPQHRTSAFSGTLVSSSKQNPGPFSPWHPVRIYSMTALLFVVVFTCATFWGKGFGVSVDFANVFEVMVCAAGINLFHIEQQRCCVSLGATEVSVFFSVAVFQRATMGFSYSWQDQWGADGFDKIWPKMTLLKVLFVYGDICKWNQTAI